MKILHERNLRSCLKFKLHGCEKLNFSRRISEASPFSLASCSRFFLSSSSLLFSSSSLFFSCSSLRIPFALYRIQVLGIRIRDPVPFWPLDLGSGIGKKIRIRDEQFGSYFRELRNNLLGKNIQLLWCGSGMEKIRIRDKHPGSFIPDPQRQHLKLHENMIKKKNLAKFHFLSNCSRCEVLQEII